MKYWVDMAIYDFDSARAMLETKRYLYVGFMCHQTIEKILKAYICKHSSETPPYTHNLTKLAKLSELYKEFSDEQKDFIDLLEPLNIEARYPSDKEMLLKSLNEQKCSELIKETEGLLLWIKVKL